MYQQQYLAEAQGLAANIKNIRNDLEGPKPLRAISALVGLSMTVVAGLGLLNFMGESIYDTAIKAYMAAFGLIVVIIESKSAVDDTRGLKQTIYRWAPFTSIVGGKGVTYVFFGTLGLSFGWHHPLLFASGCAMAAMGAIYILIHFGQSDALADKYEKSQFYNASMYVRD